MHQLWHTVQQGAECTMQHQCVTSVSFFWDIVYSMCLHVCAFHLLFVCRFKAATKKQKYEKISEKKMSTPVEILCKVRWLFTFYDIDCELEYDPAGFKVTAVTIVVTERDWNSCFIIMTTMCFLYAELHCTLWKGQACPICMQATLVADSVGEFSHLQQ